VPVREGLAAFGEIGLTGRLRQPSQVDRRLDECAKFGITEVVAVAGAAERTGVRVIAAETLRAAITAGLERERRVEEAAA
jgi:predicted ATP-dependent serine protease